MKIFESLRARRSNQGPPESIRRLDDEDRALLRKRWREKRETGETEGEAMLARLEELRSQGLRSGAGALDLSGMRLVGADLAGFDLTGADLTGADLSRADLAGATLLGAKLVGATLYHASLKKAELAGADLAEANLEGVDAHSAGFGMTNLRRTALFQANLRNATLTETDAAGADFRLAKLVGARLRDASLRGADLSLTDMREADLTNIDVHGAKLDGADLRHSVLRGLHHYQAASWIGVDIREIDFTGAYLCRRHILDENFLKEFREQSAWSDRLYKVWWITSDCGRSLTRWGILTVFIAIFFAVIYSFCELDYGDYETPLSPVYYSVVTLTTLGYGDVLPASTTSQVVAMIQVVLGYVMLGGLLSIFSNKMARRAE